MSKKLLTLTGRRQLEGNMTLKRLKTLSGLGFLAFFGLAPAAIAHPHVFIDYRLGLHQQNGHIQGFELLWTLDQENSDLIMTEFDANTNGQLEPDEAAGAAAQMVQDMSEYSFFTEVRFDGQILPLTGVQQLHARLEQNRIVYQLFLPCEIAPSTGLKTLSFKAIDPTNYVAFKPSGLLANQLQMRSEKSTPVLQSARQTYDAWLFQLVGN